MLKKKEGKQITKKWEYIISLQDLGQKSLVPMVVGQWHCTTISLLKVTDTCWENAVLFSGS